MSDEYKLTIRDEVSEFLIYNSPQGEVKVEALLMLMNSQVIDNPKK